MKHDLEFSSTKLDDGFKDLAIKGVPCARRRHNKIGVVENKNGILCTVDQGILADAKLFEEKRGIEFMHDEVLSRATFISNPVRKQDAKRF